MRAFRIATIMTCVYLLTAMVLAGCGGGDSNNSTVADIAGRWTATLTCSSGCVSTWIITLTQDGSTVTGRSYEQANPDNAAPINGTITGDSIILTESWSDQNFVYSGTIQDANHMSGTAAYIDGSSPHNWTAVKD